MCRDASLCNSNAILREQKCIYERLCDKENVDKVKAEVQPIHVFKSVL